MSVCAQRLAYPCIEQDERERPLDAWTLLSSPMDLCLPSLPCPVDLRGFTSRIFKEVPSWSHTGCWECDSHCPFSLRLHSVADLDLSTMGSVQSLKVLWVFLPVALNVIRVPQN